MFMLRKRKNYERKCDENEEEGVRLSLMKRE